MVFPDIPYLCVCGVCVCVCVCVCGVCGVCVCVCGVVCVVWCVVCVGVRDGGDYCIGYFLYFLLDTQIPYTEASGTHVHSIC